MKLYLIAVGTRAPGWISAGFEEYAGRLPRHLEMRLVEVAAAGKTRAGDVDKGRREEGARQLKRVPAGTRIVALDETGATLSTRRLAAILEEWMNEGRDTAFLVGGADGLSEECLDRADERWSLSAMTFPHALVRVILAEQLFRAWSIVSNHPYHRE